METKEKKVTKATFKSFRKKNEGNLWIKCKSNYDGMVDGVTFNSDPTFKPCQSADGFSDYNLGINGVWLVGGSRDWFKVYEENGFEGIAVSNCCGSFVLAVKK